jgi:enoyl-CoA hydratase
VETLTYAVDGRIARITLDRPERGNGITLDTPRELAECVERANLDPAVHVIALAGAGKGFCGGYDLVEFAEQELPNHDPSQPWDPVLDWQMMSRNLRGFMSLFHSDKPVVCKVHGFCVAGGTDMALCSDLLVIADDARIGYPPARVWGVPTSALWAFRVGDQRAKRLLFTGDLIDGATALDWGLAVEAPPAAELDERFEALRLRGGRPAQEARRPDGDDAQHLPGRRLLPPVVAPDRAEFERRAGVLWAEVQGTDFVGTRAALLAREVQRTKPDLIGLQEVALYRRGADGVKDGPTTPATQVVYDFLRSLRRELRRRNLRYAVGVKQQEADAEAPTDAGYDVRITMHDVILVRKRRGLRVTRRLRDHYDTELVVQSQGGTFTFTRGYAGVDVRFMGKRLRFVNTHLEAFGDDIREAQARELVARGGPLRGRRQLIVVGDMNSDPQGRESPSGAFDVLDDFGLVDTWPRRFGPGFSCCLEQSDARDPDTDGFDHRIDLILAKPRLRALRGQVVGDELRDRAANGLWPSDHAGVVTRLRLR